MLKFSWVLSILCIIITKIATQDNYPECYDANTISTKEFENLRLEDVCFKPEKLFLKKDYMCNANNLNTITATVQILLENGTLEYFFAHFVIQKNYETPCKKLYDFEKASIPYNWLYEDGKLLMDVTGYNIDNSDFCIKLSKAEDFDINILHPHLCGLTKNIIDVYIRIVSVFFMILSICVYLFSYLPQNGSVHIKCCTRYIICKTVHFSLRTIDELSLNIGLQVPSLICVLISVFGYYYIVATYLWLLVININIWKSFITYETTWKGDFSKFNKFVWRVAFGFFVFIILVDLIFTYDYDQVWPAKLVLLSCWVNTYDWMAIVFLHGPIVVLILFNITLSILTGWHIYKENRNANNTWSNSYVQNQIKNKANFQFFFRLLLFTGAFSIFEKLYNIFVILRVLKFASLDYAEPVISLQGVILFAVTVLRKEVINSLRERIQGTSSSEPDTQSTEMTNNL